MTTPTEHPGAEDSARAEAAIDELARRSGASFRRPAPQDGVAAAIAAGTKIRRRRTIGAVAGIGVLAVGAFALLAARDDDSETKTVASVPTTIPAPTSSVAIVPTSAAEAPSTTATGAPTTSAEPTVTVRTEDELPPIQSAESAGIEFIADVDRPNQVATDGTTVWVLHDKGDISRFDANSGEFLGAIPVDIQAEAAPPALGFGSLWVTSNLENKLWRIDTATGDIQATIDIPGAIAGGSAKPSPLSIGDGMVWVLVYGAGPDGGLQSYFVAVDPNTNTVARTVPYVVNAVQAGGYGFGSLWVVTTKSIVRIDPTNGEEIGTVWSIAFPTGLRFGPDAVWVEAATDNEQFVRIDPATTAVTARIAAGHMLPGSTGPYVDFAFTDGYIWANSPQAAVVKIDQATNSVVGRYLDTTSGGAVAATDTAVWFTDYATNKLYRMKIA